LLWLYNMSILESNGCQYAFNKIFYIGLCLLKIAGHFMSTACDRLTDERKELLIEMIAAGTNWRDLGTEFGIPYTIIYKWARDNKFPRGKTIRKKKIKLPQYKNESLELLPQQCNEAYKDIKSETVDTITKITSDIAAELIKRVATALNNNALRAYDCNQLALALGKAWNTYAHANKLDMDMPENTVIKWTGTE